MKKIQLQLDLTLKAPFLTHSESSKNFGLDMMSRIYNGQAVINGTQIEGLILHHLNYFKNALATAERETLQQLIKRWFGQASQGDELVDNRGELIFDYFWTCKQASTPSKRYRIGIDEQTQTVEQGNLQVIQPAFQTGEQATFSGTIEAWVKSDEDKAVLKKWLDKVLQYISAIGALKGVGFGYLEQHEIKDIEIDANKAPSLANIAEQKIQEITLNLEFDRPICLPQVHKPQSNRFVSEHIIKGSILKGAIARQWALNNDEALHHNESFSRLHLSHAQAISPITDSQSLPLPLSLTLVDNQLIDAANYADCYLLEKDNTLYAPAYAADWKDADYGLAKQTLEGLAYPLVPDIKRMLTIRTAIDAATNVAKDQQLFSIESLDVTALSNPVKWQTSIKIPALNNAYNETFINKLLTSLSTQGISGIGKTKAKANISQIKTTTANNHQPNIIAENDGQFILMLRTEARILPTPLDVSASGGSEQLKQLYSDYFQHISKSLLTLSHYYAAQSLYGGELYWRKNRQQDSAYCPEYISQEGSVFVLTMTTKEMATKDKTKALKLLNDWQLFGLPPAQDREGEDWHSDPLIKQNGYGQIVINHPIHKALRHNNSHQLIFLNEQDDTDG